MLLWAAPSWQQKNSSQPWAPRLLFGFLWFVDGWKVPNALAMTFAFSSQSRRGSSRVSNPWMLPVSWPCSPYERPILGAVVRSSPAYPESSERGTIRASLLIIKSKMPVDKAANCLSAFPSRSYLAKYCAKRRPFDWRKIVLCDFGSVFRHIRAFYRSLHLFDLPPGGSRMSRPQSDRKKEPTKLGCHRF